MNLITMSIAGGVMILATVIIRLFGLRKLPKTTFTALWAIVTLRLLIPFSLPFEGSIYTLLTNLPGTTSPSTAADLPNTAFTLYTVSRTLANPAAQGTATTPSSINPLIIIWLSGAVLLALYFVFSYFRIRRRFSFDYTANCQDAMRATGIKLLRPITVHVSSAVEVPLTYGVLRPIILLPKGTDLTDTERLRAVLAHEMVHIKKFHAVYKPLLIAALCVHWFNPLVWVMLILANRDIELLCDEAVLQALGAQEKGVYARVLLEMEEQKAGLIPMFNSFSKYALEERICSIMNFKRLSAGAIVLALALIVGVTVAFATSGAEEIVEPEAVSTESIIHDTFEDELTDAEQRLAAEVQALADLEQEYLQELAVIKQEIADKEQGLIDKEQEAIQQMADVEQELSAIEIAFSEAVTGENGEPVVGPIALKTIYISYEDAFSRTLKNRICIAVVPLPNGECYGFGANTEGALKNIVLDFLDGKVAEVMMTQDEAEAILTNAMQSVTFDEIEN